MTGHVYTVASGKGGVGKTTTVVNLGVSLRAEDHSVVLVDGDLGMSNLAAVLGVDHEPTLHDVLAGDADIDDAIAEEAEGFGVVPGAEALEGFAAADPDRLVAVLDALAAAYDYVLVDTGAGLSYEGVLPLNLADEVLIVTGTDPAAITDAAKTAELAATIDTGVLGAVVTRATPADDLDAISRDLGVEVIAAIPEDPAVAESTASGRPLESTAPDSPAARAYRKLAALLLDEEPDGDPLAIETPADESSDLEPEPEAEEDAAPTGDAEPETAAGEDTEASPEAADTSKSGGSGGMFGWFSRLFR